MRYLVTGGAGFIGSNILQALNRSGEDDILVVDNLQRSEKFLNLRRCRFADYMDKQEFLAVLQAGKFNGQPWEAIFHQGACSDTMEQNGRYMLENNFTYSKYLLHHALSHKIPFIYSSSAAVYGGNAQFVEEPAHELPLNVYGYSKLLFDQYVRRLWPTIESTVVGLRYFNVYGPGEAHKGRMASVMYHFYQQLQANSSVNLFQGSDGYADGEQRRDFVFVNDIVAVNLFFADHSLTKGIFNVGTGLSRSFNDIARAMIAEHSSGKINYIPFPEALRGKYQSFTQANLSQLRGAGYATPFTSLEEGVSHYYTFLNSGNHS